MRREPYPVGCSCCCCCCWFIRAVVLTRNLLVATGLGQQIKAEKHTEKSKKSLFTRRDDVQLDSLSVRPYGLLVGYFEHIFQLPSQLQAHLSLDQFYLSLSLPFFVCLSVKHVKCNFRNLSAHFLQLHCLATNKISIDSQLIIFQMC